MLPDCYLIVIWQHVDVFYAFHKAGFKLSARSFNVVQASMLSPCMHVPTLCYHTDAAFPPIALSSLPA